MKELKRYGVIWEVPDEKIMVIPDSICLPFFDKCMLNRIGESAYISCKRGNFSYIFVSPVQERIILKKPYLIMYGNTVIFNKTNKLSHIVYYLLCLLNSLG